MTRSAKTFAALVAAVPLSVAVATAAGGTAGAARTTPAATSVSITVSSAAAGNVPAGFVGYSYEKSEVGGDLFTASDTNLVNLFKLVGPSVLRVGGNTVDEINWSASGSGGSSGAVAPSDVDKLAAFVKATGWRVIYGINLKTNTTSNAVSEAKYAAKDLGSSLIAFEIGNEPNFYDTESQYQSSYNAYVKAIKAALPNAVFDGPSCGDTTSWLQAFGSAEKNNSLSILSSHEYVGAGSTGTIAEMFASTGSGGRLTQYDAAFEAASKSTGVSDWRLTETNSFYNGGAANVSNVEAAALWALAYQENVAADGGSGMNYHGGYNIYSPIVYNNNAPTGVEGDYYGQLLWDLGGTGPLHTASVSGGSGVTAFGIGNNVIVDNEGSSALTATITLASAATSAKSYVLTAPSLTSKSVTIAGSGVSVSGAFSPKPATVSVSGNRLTVSIPAGSADLLTNTAKTGGAVEYVGQLSGLCLDDPGSSTTSGKQLDINTCTGSAGQLYTYSTTTKELEGNAGHLCVEVAGSSTALRALVDYATCTGAANQQWTRNNSDEFVGVQSGLCMSAIHGATTPGTDVDIYTCNASGSEIWT
ncbi:MAG TPA: ricin-type beta-trefoil lectin domain protein [Acidimicrobiales bacterium]|nr:ricin-type beta-trefoil lectin domain protein [Acidimicrobiales bacterium]